MRSTGTAAIVVVTEQVCYTGTDVAVSWHEPGTLQ